jgi:PAS domain S-box-containing protein
MTVQGTGATRILVAEDSATQAQRLRFMLEQHGYAVHVEPDGAAALAAAQRLKPALVISDVNMPGMNGYELTRRIKAEPGLESLPVILVTTMSDPQEVIRGLECGADSFIIKPYTDQFLIGRIQYTLINREYRHLNGAGMGVEIHFNGQRHYITADRMQILNLLLSTYEAAIQRNRELSQSKEALERLTDEVMAGNRFLDSVVENVPIAIFIKNADDLRYARVNRTTEKLTGYTRDQMLDKSDFDLFPGDYAQLSAADDNRVLERGEISDIPNQELNSPTLGRRLLHVKKVPITDGYGDPTHLLGIAEDVTAQAEMEQAIRRLNLELEQRALHLEASNRGLESFASTASHDLRSPLALIGAYATLLEKHYGGVLDVRGRGFVQTIRTNIKRMTVLIDDLLNFSRWTRKSIELVPVDMAAIAREVAQELAGLLPEGSPMPTFEIGELPVVQADAALLRQVWVNLLSNAVKYSSKSANPQVRVDGCVEGDAVRYSVRDNGVGFDMADAGRLFEAFERLHRSDEFEGTGVGLVIVQQIVQRHGGRVWAEARPGEGAVFNFTLPRSA